MKAASKADLRRAIIAAEAAQANHPAKALPTATQRQRLDRSRRGSEELASTFLREAGRDLAKLEASRRTTRTQVSTTAERPRGAPAASSATTATRRVAAPC